VPCPFCDPPPESRVVLHEDELVVAFFDSYPVSVGHALIVPRRHVSSFFDATPEEQRALAAAVPHVQRVLHEKMAPKPDAYNVGWNDGAAAGQTVMHLHLHVIPRYEGDVPDPRGGIRWVIPEHAAYWSDDEDGDA
jgi:diadenosine tetraphosphate (Ap4A) HIT family hydrolase